MLDLGLQGVVIEQLLQGRRPQVRQQDAVGFEQVGQHGVPLGSGTQALAQTVVARGLARDDFQPCLLLVHRAQGLADQGSVDLKTPVVDGLVQVPERQFLVPGAIESGQVEGVVPLRQLPADSTHGLDVDPGVLQVSHPFRRVRVFSGAADLAVLRPGLAEQQHQGLALAQLAVVLVNTQDAAQLVQASWQAVGHGTHHGAAPLVDWNFNLQIAQAQGVAVKHRVVGDNDIGAVDSAQEGLQVVAVGHVEDTDRSVVHRIRDDVHLAVRGVFVGAVLDGHLTVSLGIKPEGSHASGPWYGGARYEYFPPKSGATSIPAASSWPFS